MNPKFRKGHNLAASYVLDARTAIPHFPGIGRYVRGLAGALSGQLNENERLTLLVPPGGDPDRSPSGQVRSVSTPISPFSLVQQWRIPPLLRGSAVYHSPYYLMPYRPGVPTVLTLYDLIPILFPEHVSLQARLAFHLTTRLALNAADRILCISRATRKDLLDHFPHLDPDTVRAIPLAPAVRFRPQPETAVKRIREKLNLPATFALYLGINKPHKNLKRLISIWPQVQPNLPLVIAGAWDPRYDDLREIAPAAERVRFIGPVPDDDLPALYSACRLFIFPSLYEGFGLPVVEALACGAAVACSNTSSLPEVGGGAVTYFNPQEADSILTGVHNALASPPDIERSTTQAGKFSWEHTAAQTLEVYRSLL